MLRTIIKTSDGNFVLCGNSNSTDGDLGTFDETQYWSGWLLKIDSNAKLLQSAKVSYEIPETWEYLMKITDIKEADDGNIVALGEVYNINSYFWWVVKIDTNNFKNKIWSETYTSESFVEYGVGITKNQDGNFTVTGYITNNGGDQNQTPHGAADIWVFTVNDEDGSMGIGNVFGGSAGDFPTEIMTLKNGNILIGGSSGSIDGDVVSNGYGVNDFWILELDQRLDTLITYRFGGTLFDKISGMTESKNGNAFYVAGITESNDPENFGYVHDNNGLTDIWIGKIAADPTLEVENAMFQETNVNFFQTQETGVFIIQNASGKKISIYDSMGREIKSIQISSDFEKVNISKNNAGLYIIDFNDNITPSIKFIKN